MIFTGPESMSGVGCTYFVFSSIVHWAIGLAPKEPHSVWLLHPCTHTQLVIAQKSYEELQIPMYRLTCPLNAMYAIYFIAFGNFNYTTGSSITV